MTPESSQLQNIRNANFDSGKLLAAFSVILIHYCPYPEPIKTPLQIFIRFAVPYFFILNGFFFRHSVIRNGLINQTLKSSKKIGSMYAVWWIIYFIFPSRAEFQSYGISGTYIHRFAKVAESTEHFVFFGPTTHLWYFPALLCAIWCTATLCKCFEGQIFPMIFSAFTYFSGVLGGAYAQGSIGLTLPVNARHAFFFSLFPFFLGYSVGSFSQSRIESLDYKILALAIALTGLAGHFMETRWITQNFGQDPNAIDYVFSTIFMSFGIFLLITTARPSKFSAVCAKFGRYSGGIYLCHILVLQRLPYLEGMFAPRIWIWISPFLALIFSFAICAILLRLPIIKRFIPA